MTSLIVLGMVLMWYQTLRFVESFPFFFTSLTFEYMADLTDGLYHPQNIKKLLKIPYSKSHVSMAVHRVGRTLLVDELDIQELFRRSSQVDLRVDPFSTFFHLYFIFDSNVFFLMQCLDRRLDMA